MTKATMPTFGMITFRLRNVAFFDGQIFDCLSVSRLFGQIAQFFNFQFVVFFHIV